jgi:hypothetical protein
VEGDLNLQEILKPVSIPKKKTLMKKVIVVKDENEKGEKAKNNWVDGEVLHLIALTGEMELELAKNAKKRVNFVFILEIF